MEYEKSVEGIFAKGKTVQNYPTTVSRSVSPGIRAPSGTCDQFSFLVLGNYLDICGFFSMVRPLS
jgi:hypothetical protein